MNNDEWNRPRKPYRVTVENTPAAPRSNYDRKPYDSQPYDRKPVDKKPKAKPVVLPQKNNANNKLLHVAQVQGTVVKISINNTLSTDTELAATYQGVIKSFDDFTIYLETSTGAFLINKSAVTVLEFLPGA